MEIRLTIIIYQSQATGYYVDGGAEQAKRFARRHNAYIKEARVISTNDLDNCICDQLWTVVEHHCFHQGDG